MATGTIKSQMKYIDTALLTFNVNNYTGNVDVATLLGIDKSRIISITPIDAAGWAVAPPAFVYYLPTGYIFCYTSTATATIRVAFRVIYI